MKFGFRTPSLKKRISDRTSWKRYIRHSMGIKMPRGYGFLTSPKKALYNKVYRKTTFGVEDIAKIGARKSKGKTTSTPKSYIPIANDIPFVIIPRLFLSLINSPNEFSKDGWAILTIIFGIVCLFANPLLGISLLAGGGYWIYRISRAPWYKAKNNIRKAKKLLKANKFSEALPLIEEAVEVEKDNHELHYMLGIAQHVNGDYEKTIEHLKKYTDLNANDLDTKLVLAYSHYKQNQYKSAVPILQRFPQDYPDYLLVILLLGDSFRGLKEYDMAIEVFKRGPLRKRKFDSYLLELHYLLGMAYKDKGKRSNALRELKRVYSFDISYKDVAKEIEELENPIN